MLSPLSVSVLIQLSERMYGRGKVSAVYLTFSWHRNTEYSFNILLPSLELYLVVFDVPCCHCIMSTGHGTMYAHRLVVRVKLLRTAWPCVFVLFISLFFCSLSCQGYSLSRVLESSSYLLLAQTLRSTVRSHRKLVSDINHFLFVQPFLFIFYKEVLVFTEKL